jgi:hypothetical protein
VVREVLDHDDLVELDDEGITLRRYYFPSVMQGAIDCSIAEFLLFTSKTGLPPCEPAACREVLTVMTSAVGYADHVHRCCLLNLGTPRQQHNPDQSGMLPWGAHAMFPGLAVSGHGCLVCQHLRKLQLSAANQGRDLGLIPPWTPRRSTPATSDVTRP